MIPAASDAAHRGNGCVFLSVTPARSGGGGRCEQIPHSEKRPSRAAAAQAVQNASSGGAGQQQAWRYPVYQEIDDLDATEIDLEHQPQASIKSYFLPAAGDPLQLYHRPGFQESGRLDYSFHAQLPENMPTVYFGVRSCDIFAVMYTDMVFLHEQERDLYYEQHRHNAICSSASAATTPFPTVSAMRPAADPFLDAGFDLQLTDLGDRWFVETGRPRGARLTEEWAFFFTPAYGSGQEGPVSGRT